MKDAWPAIPYESWQETCDALHLFAQIVGKYRLARTPWINHSWHATFYVTSRGLTTSLIPDRHDAEVEFDLIDHRLRVSTTSGANDGFDLQPMSVSQFHRDFIAVLERLGLTTRFNGRPSEIADAPPFAEDEHQRPYDRDAINRFFRASVQIDRVLKHFRTGFIGKASPVHLFWGSFDMAVTRFSGKSAPLHPGGVPALPDDVTCEAYSHQVSSAGFWPGAGLGFPAFYSYVYPVLEGFSKVKVAPAEAYYDDRLGEFILPYDAVRRADSPDDVLMSFLQSTYEAGADLGNWNRAELECAIGRPLRPRPM